MTLEQELQQIAQMQQLVRDEVAAGGGFDLSHCPPGAVALMAARAAASGQTIEEWLIWEAAQVRLREISR